jgi:hypothetical protein
MSNDATLTSDEMQIQRGGPISGHLDCLIRYIIAAAPGQDCDTTVWRWVAVAIKAGMSPSIAEQYAKLAVDTYRAHMAGEMP